MIKFLGFILIYFPFYINYSIIPNQNLKFCAYNNLYIDDNIPEEFKICLKNYFYIDIKENLLDKRFNSLNLNITKKRIYDYKGVLEENFNNNDYFFPEKNKAYAAIELLKIIPQEKEETKKLILTDIQDKQIILFKLYITFTKENIKPIEIERNDLNEKIWRYSNPYIYEIIKRIIEKHDNIDSLSKYLNCDKNKAIKFVNLFIKYTKKGKIILNQNYKFCELNNHLYNDGLDSNNKLPEELKDIAKILGFDIREHLAHEKMGRPCLHYYSYKDLCSEIDDIMIEKYNDSNNFTNKMFKKAASSLLEEYFEDIGEEKSKKYFPQTFDKKDRIILNVVYDKKQRKNMTEFGKLYGNDAISKLLKNPKLIKSIINEEITDSNYKSKIGKAKSNDADEEEEEEEEDEDLNDNTQLTINKDSKSITIPLNPEITSNKKAINFYKSNLSQILDYKDDLDFGNPVNKKSGISGEAYIYELLLNSGIYKKVKWQMLSETYSGETFNYNGKIYNIKQDDSHYDILVETYNNHKLYIEVKSTKKKFRKKVPFYLSQKQIEMIKSTKPPDKYILAVVFDVLTKPKHFFMILNDNLDKSI